MPPAEDAPITDAALFALLEETFQLLHVSTTTVPHSIPRPDTYALPITTSPQGLTGKRIARDAARTALHKEIDRIRTQCCGKLQFLRSELWAREWEHRRYKQLETERLQAKKDDHIEKYVERKRKAEEAAQKEAEKAQKKLRRTLKRISESADSINLEGGSDGSDDDDRADLR